MNGNPELWTIGKGKVKLRLIEDSITYDKREDGKVNMMLKKEVNPVSLTSPKLPTKARGIQFNVNLRTAYEYAAEQFSLCHALSRASRVPRVFHGIKFLLVYTADMNPEEISDFAHECELQRAGWACTLIDERDGKNWDANVQTVHRRALADWYGEIDPTLKMVADANIAVKGTYHWGQFSLRYAIDGTVKSGHFDTSSGNAALNLEVTAQAIAMLPGHLRPKEVRGMVMGDDLLQWLYFDQVIPPKEYCETVSALERELGIHPVRGLFSDIRHVSFCSMGFYTGSHGVAAVPKIGRMLAKLFWTVTPLNGRDPRRLASTIAHSFYPLYHTYGPMRAFLKEHMKAQPLDCDLTDFMPYILKKNTATWRRAQGINWNDNHVVKYGLCAGVLEDMEELVSEFTGIIQHPVVDIMLKEDQSDPPGRRGVLASC